MAVSCFTYLFIYSIFYLLLSAVSILIKMNSFSNNIKSNKTSIATSFIHIHDILFLWILLRVFLACNVDFDCHKIQLCIKIACSSMDFAYLKCTCVSKRKLIKEKKHALLQHFNSTLNYVFNNRFSNKYEKHGNKLNSRKRCCQLTICERSPNSNWKKARTWTHFTLYQTEFECVRR